MGEEDVMKNKNYRNDAAEWKDAYVSPYSPAQEGRGTLHCVPVLKVCFHIWVTEETRKKAVTDGS